MRAETVDEAGETAIAKPREVQATPKMTVVTTR